MRIEKLNMPVEKQAEMEYQAAQTEKQKIQMEYMSMMTGVDLPGTEGTEETGGEGYAE